MCSSAYFLNANKFVGNYHQSSMTATIIIATTNEVSQFCFDLVSIFVIKKNIRLEFQPWQYRLLVTD